MHMLYKQITFKYIAFTVFCQLMRNSSKICSYSLKYFLFPVYVSILNDNCMPMLNGLEFEFPLLTSFPETLNGSRMEVFFIARKVKFCESHSKAGSYLFQITTFSASGKRQDNAQGMPALRGAEEDAPERHAEIQNYGMHDGDENPVPARVAGDDRQGGVHVEAPPQEMGASGLSIRASSGVPTIRAEFRAECC